MAVYEEEEEGGLLAAVFAGKRMKEAVTEMAGESDAANHSRCLS